METVDGTAEDTQACDNYASITLSIMASSLTWA